MMDEQSIMTIVVACLCVLALLSVCVATKKRKQQSATTTTAAAAVRNGDVATRLFHAPSLGGVTATASAAAVSELGVNDAAHRDHVALVHMLPDGQFLAFNVAMNDTVDLHARVVQHVIEKTNNWLLVCQTSQKRTLLLRLTQNISARRPHRSTRSSRS